MLRSRECQVFCRAKLSIVSCSPLAAPAAGSQATRRIDVVVPLSPSPLPLLDKGLSVCRDGIKNFVGTPLRRTIGRSRGPGATCRKQRRESRQPNLGRRRAVAVVCEQELGLEFPDNGVEEESQKSTVVVVGIKPRLVVQGKAQLELQQCCCFLQMCFVGGRGFGPKLIDSFGRAPTEGADGAAAEMRAGFQGCSGGSGGKCNEKN